MENKFRKIRKELDELGYHQTLTPECLPLVERLVGDLKTTTESLEKYMNIAKQAIEERDNLEFGAEPYRCDNAKLVKECNELHIKLIQAAEQHEKWQKELKRKIGILEKEKQEAVSEIEKLRQRIIELESELSTFKLQKRKSAAADSKSKLKSSSTSALLKEKENHIKKATTFELNSAMALADQKIACLGREVKRLKEQHLELMETNEMYKNQLVIRDREIERLKSLLEGGRPMSAVTKDCCYRDVDGKLHKMQDEINSLKKEKGILEDRLKETLAKQHEAMKRALHLAERNKHLEKELKDIDQIALQVEAECNNTVKANLEKVNRLQERLQDTMLEIQSLERENAKVKQEKNEMKAELDAVQAEKRQLQANLETALDDKKRLNDRINQFTIIEHDLNMEIDRLVRLSAEQKRKIAELEGNLQNERASVADVLENQKQDAQYSSLEERGERQLKSGRHLKKHTKRKTKHTAGTKSPTRAPHNTPKDYERPQRDEEEEDDEGEYNREVDKPAPGICCRGCCSTGGCAQHFRELLNKEIEYRQAQSAKCIESLKNEKEYYMEEYRKLVNEMKNNKKTDNNAELIARLNEKEQAILNLQHENKILSEEKYNLMSRLESARDRPSADMEGTCVKNYCKRMEREREILRADIERLEEERDCLRQRIKTMSEAHTAEHQRLQASLQEYEAQVRKLELERRELMQTQGTRRANISCLEEQVVTLKDQLRTAQNELNHQRGIYSQLKNLHEQTDKALSDCQGQLIQVESELAHAQERIRTLEREKTMVGRDDGGLKKDCQVLKNQLMQMDKEKDEILNALDEKTEKIAQLQKELGARDNRIASLESTVQELRAKISSLMDETGSREVQLRSSNSELNALRRELEMVKNAKDSLAQENRRLQDDVRSLTCGCRESRDELDLAKRQIEDLKRQLQHYVAEVKRTEDILSQKEIERNELLDQFRNLSHEANVLETNNHSLENEASESKIQLSVALDHAAELEKKIENQESLIRSYEKQIADMTAQIASLEFKASHGSSQSEKLEAEVRNLKELCTKLDNEKDELRRQLLGKSDQTMRMERNVDRLKCECDSLQNAIEKDRDTIESLEKLLSDARQEAVEQKVLNQELQAEIQRLKSKLNQSQDRLMGVSPVKSPTQASRCDCPVRTNLNINLDTRPMSLLDKPIPYEHKSYKYEPDRNQMAYDRTNKFACNPDTCNYSQNDGRRKYESGKGLEVCTQETCAYSQDVNRRKYEPIKQREIEPTRPNWRTQSELDEQCPCPPGEPYKKLVEATTREARSRRNSLDCTCFPETAPYSKSTKNNAGCYSDNCPYTKKKEASPSHSDIGRFIPEDNTHIKRSWKSKPSYKDYGNMSYEPIGTGYKNNYARNRGDNNCECYEDGDKGYKSKTDEDYNKNKFCSSFCIDGPHVQSYTANYTVVHSPEPDIDK